jgi:hypothetical protein
MVKVGFLEHHLCLRGTTTALYDYACANVDVVENTSVILYQSDHPENNAEVIEKFRKRFQLLPYKNISELDSIITREGIQYLYVIKYGNIDAEISNKVPTLVHSVFAYQPHGKYATVSAELALENKADWLPHIVNPLNVSTEKKAAFRDELKIPQNAIVYGRYGGSTTFSIQYVKECIIEEIEHLKHVWFVFAGTVPFFKHPRVIFLEGIADLDEKATFVSGCDYMLHARTDGETFGLAVAEFATAGRPVLTTHSQEYNDHIHLLGDRAIIYNDKENLRWLFHSLSHPKPFTTPDPYAFFTPKNMMKRFWAILLDLQKTKNYIPGKDSPREIIVPNFKKGNLLDSLILPPQRDLAVILSKGYSQYELQALEEKFDTVIVYDTDPIRRMVSKLNCLDKTEVFESSSSPEEVMTNLGIEDPSQICII